ncbi:Ger(x)C family spore germination protein [Sporosarcina sp. ACRSL]|uniref:Ger(x)C family spore germination protein n=1 Tax=Sporosarcina sp. ACRSL TaxID=2918215 RepID=UPI001EF600AB|nr:Ger(x)C family spore germination protein [Sporosarcina sp. ACRSL]MCG7345634.1 Ger(x)C family spore germination protein [Sporosarcina sp. ACRSL]
MAEKQKIIKGCIATGLFLMMLLQAGCAFKDIDKRIFVVGIGVDPSEKVKDGFRVTLKLAKPYGNVRQAQTPTYAYLSHDADSVAVAVAEMETRVDKLLDLTHNRIIIINKELLTKDLHTVMDFFTRRGDIQMVCYIAIAGTTSEEAISFEPTIETPASIALYNYFDNTGTESPYIVTTFLFEFRRELLEKGKDTVLPIIDIDEENQEYKVNKSIVFRLDKEPLELTPEETKYFNSLANRASGFSYKFQDKDHSVVLNIYEVRFKYEIILNEGEPRIDIKVTKVGYIGESKHRLDPSKLDKYNKLAAKDTKAEVMDLLTKLQEKNLDPFGFGLRYHATRLSRKGIMEEWERIYPEIKFNVTVNVKLKGTGAVE